MKRVVELFPPGWKPARTAFVDRLYSLVVGGAGQRKGVRRLHLVYAGATLGLRTADLDRALRRLESSVVTHVAERGRRRVFARAGVVGWRDRAIVLLGSHRTRRSCLVTALVRRGATHYADEFAVLDHRGRVHPFATLRGRRGRADSSMKAAGRRLPPLPAALLALTGHRPKRRWRPRRLSRGGALLELLANALPARRAPDRVLDTLTRVVEGALVLKGASGEADETAHALLDPGRWPAVDSASAAAAPRVAAGASLAAASHSRSTTIGASSTIRSVRQPFTRRSARW